MSTKSVPDEAMKRMYDYSDPKRVGRGSWLVFMIMSINSETEAERLHACKVIRAYCRLFKCKECNGHCTKYIEENPPENSIKSRYGLFDWVVAFMSAVNIRTNRPAYDRNILFTLFTDEEYMVCEAGCGGDDADSHSLEATVPPIAASGDSGEWLRKVENTIPGLVSIQPYKAPAAKAVAPPPRIKIVARSRTGR